jgi:hypothetical protein
MLLINKLFQMYIISPVMEKAEEKARGGKRIMRMLIILLLLTQAVLLSSGCTAQKSSPSPAASTGKEQGMREITKDQYDKVVLGMPFDEAMKIVGGESQRISEEGKKGETGHKVTYQYKAKNDPSGQATLTFLNEKLLSKSEAGLK